MIDYKLIHDETCELWDYLKNFMKEEHKESEQIFEEIKRFADKMANEGEKL